MKMIHCGDLHLDSELMTHLSVEQAKERNIELLHTFQKMVEYGENEGVQAVLLAGDIFDKKNVATYVQHTVIDTIQAHKNMFFFYVSGNHDRDCFLEHLETVPSNLKIFGKEWKSFLCGNIAITGVKCEGISGISLAEKLSLNPENINIVMLHGQEHVNGANSQEDIVPVSLLKQKGIDYLALGHIHSYKQERLDARGIYCYSGCLEGRGFDECGIKGFVRLDIEETTGVISSEFVPFGKRRLWEICVDATGSMTTNEMERRIEHSIQEKECREADFLKIVLQGELDVESEKNLLFLQKKYEELFYYVKIVDETKFKVDYTDYMLDECLKGEFVRMVQEGDLSQEEKAEVIRCGIMALAGEEIDL